MRETAANLTRQPVAPSRRKRRRPRTSRWRPPKVNNPLDRSRPGSSTRWLRWLAIFAGTIGLHAIGLVGFAVASLLFPEPPQTIGRSVERVELRVTDRPEAVAPAAPETPAAAPPPSIQAKPAPPAPTLPKPFDSEPPAPPPPDPVNLNDAADPPSADSAPKQRRIVGLSFESTVSAGGTGPAFSTGNTRMGSTAPRAEKPGVAPKLSPNRLATRVPPRGATFTKPKRIAPVEPEYPELLRARGIEADVVVFVSISTTGVVTNARVVKRSPHPPFNTAALAAARAQRFEPATRDGTAVPYSLKYTYRFRLDRT